MTDQPVALVTGGASGIGAAVVEALTARGYTVGCLDLNPGPAENTWAVDVSDADAVARAVGQLQDRLGPVSAVVTSAGYYEMAPVSDISEDAWRRMLRVHLGGLVNVARATLPDLTATRGSLVAVASELAVGGGDEDAHYAAAKGAILGLVRSLAVETASSGVRVNAVAPGPTDTPLLAPDSPWRAPEYLQTLPLRRLTTPAEVARCVEYLVCDATFSTGDVVNVNSGAVI
ncbi:MULTISPECIES: SDR family NAD(P)-dependent oxidoreductase [Mycolicibacterium]|jgi:NAD(P)-dependent dehydrogenase (short-subunit alcohol dehydrogenase family)|uniref:Short-chain dehydrogenase/reductase SDR n=2 Tax=Mycolicibacterium TaxID=1866885 RepID=A1T145_MYCVP|nr:MULTISPECIES: SDR family oxidoreductase [Mycolicibacterium]ABM10895.1 short-chain dehydrogenase/reductase SDR [Mycolicibacterium vanbaalenii PYR-1]MCV7127399.1 SDR family oxidoreductase [Mycolicibacterium vanbaalenii PYR-1]MDN4516399.1 SDR family oxidoreductase [Mycolicibacterium austroafricanum]QRZ07056.1 SDR family oxidoreductase [Mycolicibacterium austroafricanum]QZT68541.1 SDR family oxidoreductase [Mycolicibacterium austroafricanum]